jgi:hypothetical protein
VEVEGLPQIVIELLTEVQGMDAEMFPPAGTVDDGETVIAEVPMELRKIYALAMCYGREMEQHKLESRYCVGEESVRHQAEMCKARLRREILLGMRSALNLWTVPHIGVRQGWKVVQTPCGPQLPPFLRTLFGQQE